MCHVLYLMMKRHLTWNMSMRAPQHPHRITWNLSVVFCQNWKPGKSGELSSALPPVDSDIIWFYMEYTPIKYQRIYKLDANNIVDEIKW